MEKRQSHLQLLGIRDSYDLPMADFDKLIIHDFEFIDASSLWRVSPNA